jgi:hypothetical protein
MDTKLAFLKETGKLSAYVFVTVVLTKNILTQWGIAGIAFNNAFKK